MADLDGRSRGQIILVAAFALAVIFITLALIVNSAIFTQNLASRGETSGADDALSHRAMVEESVGDGVVIANRRNNSSQSDLEGAVKNSIDRTSIQGERQQVRSGQLTSVTYISDRDGVRIVQNTSTNFKSSNGASEYSLARNVERVDGANGTRAFRINASSINVSQNSSAFEIKVNQSSAVGNRNSWRTRFYKDGSDTVRVRTHRNRSNTNTQTECKITVDSASPSFQIDVTGGTINGKPCEALGTTSSGENYHFGSGTGVEPGTGDTYNVYFRNAQNITGNFSMVAYTGSVGSEVEDIGDGSPYETEALYDVTVNYTYETSRLRYNTTIRVAPGEPDA